ncbi:unnamed protein product, partial [Prorocentrum cordatum]
MSSQDWKCERTTRAGVEHRARPQKGRRGPITSNAVRQLIDATPQAPKENADKQNNVLRPPTTPAQMEAYKKDMAQRADILATMVLATRRSGSEDEDTLEELATVKYSIASMQPAATRAAQLRIELEESKPDIERIETKIEQLSAQRDVQITRQDQINTTLQKLDKDAQEEAAARAAEAVAAGVAPPQMAPVLHGSQPPPQGQEHANFPAFQQHMSTAVMQQMMACMIQQGYQGVAEGGGKGSEQMSWLTSVAEDAKSYDLGGANMNYTKTGGIVVVVAMPGPLLQIRLSLSVGHCPA